jgi:hydrogenase small subunit
MFKEGRGRETIASHLENSGVSRRDFLELCGKLMIAAPVGLALTAKPSLAAVAETIGKARRPSVIWLHLQECTGCTETLLRTSAPDVANLILNVISLDYHETLMAAAGAQAEAALKKAVSENDGKFVLVVEGAIPTAMDGKYLIIAGKPGITMLKEVAVHAAAVIAMGSCASWGGVPSADPNPTGAVGVDSIITDKPVVNLPGCPPSPYNLLGTALEYASIGKLPALDSHKRPLFAYGRLIHDHCPRRAHFDAGRFARQIGDETHRQGLCMYQLGCKGPVTYSACPTRRFNELPDAWPIGVGAPCVGCTEKAIAFRVPIFTTVDIHAATPPEALPLVHMPTGSIGVAAAGLAGAIAGGLGGAAWMAARRLPSAKEKPAADKAEPSNPPATGPGGKKP